MPTPKVITSPQNPSVKFAIQLRDNRERKKQSVFGIEGAREIDRALRSGFVLTQWFYAPDLLSPLARKLLQQIAPVGEQFEITPALFNKIALREDSDGVFGIFQKQTSTFSDLPGKGERGFIVALHGMEKPGNLGAVLRSADGAGVDGIVLIDEKVDRYHPHVIRASLGTAFAKPIVSATSAEFLAYCQKTRTATYAAALSPNSVPYHVPNYRQSVAIVLGNEAKGLPVEFQKQMTKIIQIPMGGIADSLNVSAASAVLVYEVNRQRSAAVSS